MPEAYDSVQRFAAESVASREGISIEQALEGIEVQGKAKRLIEGVEETLGDASGGVWFDWTDGRCRLTVGVTTRAERAKVENARRIVEEAGLQDRVTFVNVVWSTRQLEEAQERAEKLLETLEGVPWSSGRDPSSNAIRIDVPDDLTAEQLTVVEAAIGAARVGVQVATGADWAVAAA
jgi:hypothetical protein